MFNVTQQQLLLYLYSEQKGFGFRWSWLGIVITWITITVHAFRQKICSRYKVFHTSCNSATQEVSTGLEFNTLSFLTGWVCRNLPSPFQHNLEKTCFYQDPWIFRSLLWRSLGTKGKNHSVMSDFSIEAESWAQADTGATPIVQIRDEVEHPISSAAHANAFPFWENQAAGGRVTHTRGSLGYGVMTWLGQTCSSRGRHFQNHHRIWMMKYAVTILYKFHYVSHTLLRPWAGYKFSSDRCTDVLVPNQLNIIFYTWNTCVEWFWMN